MFKKMKGLLSLFISISILCTVIPVTGYAADTQPVSKLFSTTYGGSTTLISKAVNKGLTPSFNNIKSVSFVDLKDYDLTGVKTVDYSADGDGSVLAWYNNNTLYIGGYGKIIAGGSLSYAFYHGTSVDAINGFDMLDTSNVTDMSDMFERCGSKSASFKLDLGNNFDTSNVTSMRYMFKECGSAEKNTGFTLNLGNKFDTSKVKNMSRMFNYCGWYSTVFTLDLGDKFDTSNVTSMDYMFDHCGYKSKVFKLDLGSKFDTSKVKDMSRMFADCGSASESFTLNLGNKFKTANVTDMRYMFFECGKSSKNFTELDLSGFTISFSEVNSLANFAGYIPVTTFIFGDGWADAVLPEPGSFDAVFASMSTLPTYITGATSNLVNYNWSADKRPATFTDKGSVTITAEATEGGTVSGGGTVIESANVKLTASANEGYNFDGWYDGDTKVCDTEEFLVKNVTADKTYTAKFTAIVKKISKLFSTGSESTLLSKAVSEGLVSSITDIEGVSFVNLGSYDLTNVTTADYSADGDGYVLAWYDNKTLYIGGYETIIAGDSLAYAFYGGKRIDAINGIDMLDTSNVTNMASMFEECGQYSALFTLDLGNNFDTSNVTDMSHMFDHCGLNSTGFTFNLGNKFNTSKVTNMEYMFYFCGEYSDNFTLDLGDEFDTSNVTNMSYMFAVCGVYSEVFTLDFGDKFDTSKVTDMSYMFYYCGKFCPAFTDLDLSEFTISISDENGLFHFAEDTSVTSFIFGDGWANAPLPLGEMFRVDSSIATKVTGAPKNLFAYDWATDNREVTFTDKIYFTITAEADEGGMVSGSGLADTGESITLTATPDYGYTFDGWYDGDTRVCDTAEFVVENVTADKTYTAKFTKNIVYYTISAEVGTDGGTVSGGGKVAEGESVTLTAAANEGYTFDGWYDGDTKICDTAEFVVSNVTADKTYTAKFTKNPIVDPDPTFDFTSLRTLKTKNITVNHETKTIDIDSEDNAEYITIFVHQKDVIPGGTFKMASYMGNKVVYDKNGSYRIYFVHNFTVPVKANITINGVSEQYLVNVHFDTSKAKFDFTSLKGESFSNITVNHDEKTVHITANDSADDIILYVNQHSTVYGGKLRMASYLGNKVTYDPSGVYTIYANGKNSVSVKTNITINGVTEQYLITVDFPSVVWGFDNVNAENVKNVSIDHENKVITLDVNDNCDNLLLYIDQICQSNIKGQIWMKSYMGNKVVYNASDRTYTITKKDKNSITVKTKITMLGETRYYDININFAENN